MGLLHSQHESVLHENSPYERFHSGSSEIPQFSSHQCEAPTPTPPTDIPVERGKRHKWTPTDDELLISAWLNTSKETIVGNNQKSGTFWQRVGDYFLAALLRRDGRQSREHLHYKQRWHKINDQTNKFCGAYAAAERQISSGQNDNDVLEVAHDIFYSDQESKFTLEHAWCVLRHEHKWLSLNTTKACGSSKRKSGETGSQLSSTSVTDHEIWPEGVKAAKARGKKKMVDGKDLSEYQTMWVIRQQDIASKERLLKFKLLESLIAKQELADYEEVLKKKLVDELISP